MYKKILILLFVCAMLSSCKKDENVLPVVETPVEYNVEDKYELTALNSDKQGIDNTTVFQLTSKVELNDSFIKNNLEILPAEDYKIEKVSGTLHNIIPLADLRNDQIYQIKINDKDEDYNYSWAFQTKKKFEVEGTLPADKSSYVPSNSGIEMYFSLSGLGELDDFFEIKPHVEGKFLYKNNTAIFVPDKFEENINYTVTIKKGYGLKDSPQKLEEDYSFSFNTKLQKFAQVYFDRPLTNIYENNVKVIEAYINNENLEFDINIYQYTNADFFAESINDFADTGKFFEDSVNDIEGLTFLNALKQKPNIVNKYNNPKGLFELPDLPKGYYLLEFSTDDGETNYHFLQINNMLIYYALFSNQIVVTASDGADSKGIVDAAVVLNGEHMGFTDNNGMLIIDRDTSVYENKAISLRVEAKGFNDFVYADSLYFYNYYYNSQYEAYKYLRYIDTDRPVYLPTDTINVWGFARHKDDKSVNKVRIELVEVHTNLVFEEKTVDLTNIGTYQTEFEIKNAASEYFNFQINVYDNDLRISTKYISIGKYTKPLFTISGEFDKKFVYSGESINYKVNANFFDGNPLPGLELKFGGFPTNYSGSIDYGQMDSTLKLNEKGETLISVNTNVNSDSWRPVSIRTTLWNAKAEDKSVGVMDTFEIFPHHKMVEIEQNDMDNPENIRILLHELDITKYDSQYFSGYEKLRGNPLSGTVLVSVTESYYEKYKKGEHYDYINKVNVIEYGYNHIKNIVFNEITEITGGCGNVIIPDFNPQRTYEVAVEYMDENGVIREYSYVGSYYRFYERPYYYLEKDDDNKQNYRLNDNINLNLMYSEENVESTDKDKLILLIMRDGLIDYKITDDTKLDFEFKEEYIPNVMINSIYFKNGYMYPVEFINSLYYDTTERQIHFDVTTDKENYRPGEEVLLSIKTKDENNKPIKADVNISVVDEAYFALFEKRVDTLNSLYGGGWSTGLNASYLSNIDLSIESGNGAERGGGGDNFTGFRDEFKDTNIFKTITTDKNGNGELKFKLADNLTSWRITYQGISDKKFAGSGTKNITVSLPFFVDIIMSEEYLKDDKISASLRVFGTEAKESEEVNYEIKITNKETGKELKYAQTGIIGDYTNISFDKLSEGTYEISVYAAYKDFEDGIKEEFNVVDSFVYFNNTTYYKLSEDTVLSKVYSNPVITLFNESRSDFYNSLESILGNYGKRIDQTVCSMLASKYINDYFKTDLTFNEDDLISEINRYEIQTSGGYSLFTYSNTDAEITAKLMNLVDNEYLRFKSKTYFKNILGNPDYNSKIPAALWGLSTFKEPVLLTVYDLLENNTLEIRDKIYLSLALAEFGDFNTAKKYYKEFSDSFKESGDYLYFESGADENYKYSENYELTALLSVLGCKLQDYDTSDKLFKYIYNNPSKFTLSNFEQLIYIMDRNIMNLDEIKDLFGEVTVTSEGKDKTYKLNLFDRENFSVPKDKIQDIKFKNIKGSIACKVEALGNKDDLDKNKTEDFSINANYTLKDSTESQMSYNHSDLVKVTIMPSFSDNVVEGNYEITYVVPAGFRFIELDRKWPFWVEENGQKLRLFFYYNRQTVAAIPITFYIQAAQIGEYTVDYVVIKENLETRLNYIDKEVLTVQ